MIERQKRGMEEMKKKKTSLYLEVDLKKEIQIHCIKNDISFNEWVTEAVKEKLKRESLDYERK
jgi:predicted HicB family RNase H-like nuclease